MNRTWVAILLLAAAAGGAFVATAKPDPRKAFRERVAAVKPTDAAELYRLALVAREAGYVEEARGAFLRCLRADPDHRAARRALGYELVGGLWLKGDAAMRAKGFVLLDGEWVLREELETGEAKARAQEEEAGKALVALAAPGERTRELARRTLEALPAVRLVRPCMVALERGPAQARLFATRRLSEEGTEECLTALIRSSIMDTSPQVREAATAAVAAADEPDAIYPYLRALDSDYAPVRVNAARALGQVGDVRGIETVIRHLAGNHGGGPRVNIQVGRQTTYIRDFDVEIAQAAQIGDPIIGTIQEGVVLDVRVFNVETRMTTIERRLLFDSLARISGVDHGEDVAAWTSWWKENRERMLKDL